MVVGGVSPGAGWHVCCGTRSVGLAVFSPSPGVSKAVLGSPAGLPARRWTGDWMRRKYMPQHKGRRWISGRAVAISGCATLLGGFVLAGPAGTGLAATTASTARTTFHATSDSTCHLGNGIQHVVQITFD